MQAWRAWRILIWAGGVNQAWRITLAHAHAEGVRLKRESTSVSGAAAALLLLLACLLCTRAGDAFLISACRLCTARGGQGRSRLLTKY